MIRPLLLLSLLAPLAAAQPQRPCPLDQTPLTAPASQPGNLGGGVDPDGCGYAVDAHGTLRVADLDDVVLCPSCGAAFAWSRWPDHLDPDTRDAARAALDPAPRGVDPWVRAAETWAALRAADAPLTDPWRTQAELWTRAAWAARGRAVLAPPHSDFRPGGLSPEALTRAHAWLLERDEAVRRARQLEPVEAALIDLERARLALETSEGDLTGAERWTQRRVLRHVRDAEQRLFDLLPTRDADRTAEPGARELALARAWARYGDSERWRAWAEEARRRAGTTPALRDFLVALADEAERLDRAQVAWEEAASRAEDPEDVARCWYLAADAARRCDGDARAAYVAAQRAAPQSRAGRAAEHFLGED